MQHSFFKAGIQLLRLLQVSLLLLSLAIVLIPATRSELRPTFHILFLISCMLVVVRAYKRGYIRDSVEATLRKLQSGDGRMMSFLERASFISAVIAATMLAFA